MPSNKYAQETVDKALESAERQFKNGGAHLGVVRRWMQYNFRNGETVTWGSQECLTGTMLTPMEMERLATRIMEQVVKEFRETFTREVKMLQQFEEDPMQVKIFKRGESAPTFEYVSTRGYTDELRTVQEMFKVMDVGEYHKNGKHIMSLVVESNTGL